MKLRRDVSGEELAKRLGRLGYRVTRQTGSHLRSTCDLQRQHHLTIPAHTSLREENIDVLDGVFVPVPHMRGDEPVKVRNAPRRSVD